MRAAPPLVAATIALAVFCGLATTAQEKPPEAPAPPGQVPPRVPPAPGEGGLKPVPAPPALGGRQLPAGPGGRKPPPVETIDDPGAALVIDGERVPRATFGEALIEEFGDSFIEPFVAVWLIERRAKQLGVALAPGEVEASVEKQKRELLEKRYRGDETQLRAALAGSGLTLETWTDSLIPRHRRDLLTKAVVRADRDVSEEGLRREFEARWGPDGVKRWGRYIFISTQVWSSGLYTQADFQRERADLEADAKKRAEAAAQELKDGKDFAALARERSEDPLASQGGLHGVHWRNRFGTEADAVLAALKPGETSAPIATPRGTILARVTGTQEGWEIKARHILLSSRLSGQMDPAFREKKMAELRAEAAKLREEIAAGKLTFVEAAAKRTDDPQGRDRGGDAGTFQTGSRPAEFEAACLATAEGEMSAPIETPLGVQIVKVEKKTRRPENDQPLMRILLFSTEFLKVKERKLKDTIEAKAKTAADELAAKLKAGADGAELARAHSDDLATRDQGGAIEEPLRAGTSQEQEAVQAFRGLAETGAVAVVKGKSGWHVLKLEKIEHHDFAAEREALKKDVLARDVTPTEVREYRERLRAGVKVQKSRAPK